MFDRAKARYDDFKRVSEDRGFQNAVLSTVSHIRRHPRTLFLADHPYQTSERIDNDHRWQIISDAIEPQSSNLLDFGCNQGALTRRAAKKGLFSIGVDRKSMVINTAKRKSSRLQCHYIFQDMGPTEIKKLPQFDVVLCLTVYYHLGDVYGWSEAEKTLQYFAGKSNQLFIETPNSFEYIKSEKLDTGEDPKIALEQYFDRILSEHTVEFIGETPYKGENRTDVIFSVS